MIQVGQPAPDFTLEGVLDGEFVTVTLSQQRGSWVVLFFYPLDFTFVCPTEIRGFAQRRAEFEALGAKLLAASTDSKYSHLAWCERDLGKLGFPLLSDMTRDVARDYGVLLADEGHTLRGTFVVDPDGLLRYMVVHDNNVGRNTEETLRVLEALQTGELCPVDWRPGEATIPA
jgi:alkyl hydroperoxide reductase subunit AhpC